MSFRFRIPSIANNDNPCRSNGILTAITALTAITNPWLVMACSCYARLRAEDVYMTNVGNVTKYLKQILLHLNWRQYISGNKGNVGK